MLLFILIVMWLANCFYYFNTSHVTVYHNIRRRSLLRIGFQYISCYCLSTIRTCYCNSDYISIHLMLLFILFSFRHLSIMLIFQYISCYCLSTTASTFLPACKISIHLMLLFIPTFLIYVTSCYVHFNTSHVTVYHTSLNQALGDI